MKPKNQRLVLVIAAVIAVLLAVLLAMWGLRERASYFYAPADVVSGKAEQGRSVRLGGMVERRSIQREPDGVTIRMAPPFSGVPTQHEVEVAGRRYFANCAWDCLGIPAALKSPAVVRSRCERTLEPLTLEVATDAPPASDWIFHCQVPASHWWDDLVFT